MIPILEPGGSRQLHARIVHDEAELRALLELGHLTTVVLARSVQPILVAHLLQGVSITLQGDEARSQVVARIESVVTQIAADIGDHLA